MSLGDTDMSSKTRGFSQFIKRVFLKYVVGYRNEQKYWNKRWKMGLKDENWSVEQRKTMVERVQNMMQENQCLTFLDVGCGKAELRDLKGYIGLDFSLEGIKKSGLKEAIFADITDHIPLPDKSMDVAFTNYVLLHIRPEKIEKAVSELSRITKKMLILNEPPYCRNGLERQIHCFNHNLPEIIGKHFEGKVVFP